VTAVTADHDSTCHSPHAINANRSIREGGAATKAGIRAMNAMTTVIPLGIPCPAPVINPNRLQIHDLVHTYRNGVRALAGVTLNIPRGMYGLLGPNGAGKSTLMRILATLQSPTSGRVTFDGVDILAEPTRLRKLLGYLPQDFGVYPRMSAEALLDYLAVLKGIGPKKVRREEVHALLQQTNLYEARNRAVASFSGGMRQRFGIAQALLGNPQLIIVDEPTAGLDPAERIRFHDLLAEIGEHAVVILSTHILEDVSELCKRMAIIVGGRVVAEGSPRSLVAQLHGRLWRKAVTQEELPALRKSCNVISTRYLDGRTMVFVLSDERPGADFELASGDLQDVYFATVANDQRAAA
jgi:ABC-2 type transport system ATP-binding protein